MVSNIHYKRLSTIIYFQSLQKKFEINITIIYGQCSLQFPYTHYVVKFMSRYSYHIWFSVLFFFMLLPPFMVTWFVWPHSCFAFLLIYHTFINIYQHQYVFNFHQRYSTASVSNTTKSFCVPWSWTNNLSCWNKSYRKNGGWLSTIRGFYLKTSSLNEMWKKVFRSFFWRLFVSQWQL